MKSEKPSTPDRFPVKLAVISSSLWLGVVIICALIKLLTPANSIYGALFLPLVLIAWLMTPFGLVATILLLLRKFKPDALGQPKK